MRGEILIAIFIAEHHVAIRAVDHLTELIKTICHDSKIVSKTRFHRTKATTLIQVIASDIQSLLIYKVCNFFSIAFDETTDVSTTKIVVTMPRYFDEACGSVNTILYKIDEVPIADVETLFNVLDTNLTNDLLSYEKIVSVSTKGAKEIQLHHD